MTTDARADLLDVDRDDQKPLYGGAERPVETTELGDGFQRLTSRPEESKDTYELGSPPEQR